ncbi:unnamed protein product [Calypogeia fissa]
MWAPHPRGRIIRRPQPDFSHHRSRIQRRPAQQELLDSVPDPRGNYKYFGIHRSDITDHLKITVPSHAFHPSLVGESPPIVRGRGPRCVKRRPETAPAATVWFGRTCSDVSDWLRYRPPAHLGLDPDNKPLPSYPTSSSLVTDPKWQTKEFPALPNVLWHWWKERPSSVPLATKPQQVKFDTLVGALKDRVVRRGGPYTTPPNSAPTTAAPTPTPTPRPTPRSGAQTPRNFVSVLNGEAHQSRAQTPQLQPGSGDRLDPGSLEEFPVRPASVSCSTLPSRPGSAAHVMSTNVPATTPRGRIGLILEGSTRPPSTPRHHSAGESPRSLKPQGPCGCDNLMHTPRSGYGARGVGTSTPRSTPPSEVQKIAQVDEVEKSACDWTSSGTSSLQIPSPRPNLEADGETLCTTSAPNKAPSPTISSRKLPPSPKLSHPDPPHVPRQAIPCKPCGRHHAEIPSGLYVQGKGQGPRQREVERKTPREEIARSSQGLTVEDMKKISPDSFATKIVWAEKLKAHGQGLPWPFEEKKALKTVKVY